MAIEAAKEIEAGGKVARVVSMVCWELFEDQDESYKNSILPPDVTARVSTVVPHALHILLLMKLTALGDPCFSFPGCLCFEADTQKYLPLKYQSPNPWRYLVLSIEKLLA